MICRSRSSSDWRFVQPLDHALRGCLGIGGVDPLLLASALFLAQPGCAGVPIIDFARQPGPDLALDLVDLCEPAPFHLGQVVRNEAGNGISQCTILNPLRPPRRGDYLGDSRTLLRLDRSAIEVRSRAAVYRAALFFRYMNCSR